MACQINTGSGSGRAVSNHDLLNRMVSFLTSRHVATVAINNGGTGGTYVVGDIVTLTHAGAHLDAKFEVLTVSAGQILTMRIHSSGAFGDRPNGSITISAGGTGYTASQTDIILELQGGSSRCPAKVKATTNGSGVVTSAVAFEDLGTGGLGVYSSLPSYPAATVVKGPNGTGAGTGCTITMGGSTSIIGTTGLAVTGGGGTGATVDITLAETGWSVDGRNDNDRNINSVLNEKTVVLVGDATGWTNKPFIAYMTGNATSGLNTRYAIATMGLIAHNPALLMTQQSFRSPNLTSETALSDGGSYITCSQDSGAGTDEMDFWIKADDTHVSMITQIEETAATSDNGVYVQHYAGYMNRVGTETEAPYPMFIFGSSRAINEDPKVGSVNITGIAEQRHASSGPGWYYDNVAAAWQQLINDDTAGSPAAEDRIMSPAGTPNILDTTSLNRVVDKGFSFISLIYFELDRSSASAVLRKVPGTVDEFFLFPLTVRAQPAAEPSAINDRYFGQPRGIFWISSDDGTGSRIADFSEDYVTVAGDRYLCFHNHVHTEPYQYIAWKWDV
jgi:hypothetical protein